MYSEESLRSIFIVYGKIIVRIGLAKVLIKQLKIKKITIFLLLFKYSKREKYEVTMFSIFSNLLCSYAMKHSKKPDIKYERTLITSIGLMPNLEYINSAIAGAKVEMDVL